MNLVAVLRSLGPGIVMAATAIGTSHLILAPVAGARFGYGLVWLVVLAHLFKYPAFEFGPRYAVATGRSLIHGYQGVPGPRNWAVWAFLGTTILQGLTILAGILSVTAAILHASFGTLDLDGWVAAIGLIIAALLVLGRYPVLEAGSKLAMAALALVSLLAFAAAPPSLADLGHMVIPSLPGGSLIMVAAILGLMPSGINVAIWHSLWALEHMEKWRSTAPDRPGMLRLGLFDLKVGYLLSAVLAVVFVALGAELLQPRGLVPSGIEVAVTLSRIYTDVLGDWMYPVFMTAAFLAMFSTAYSVMDGFPRTFATLLRTLFPERLGNDRAQGLAYWGFMSLIFVFAVSSNNIFPNPVRMVQIVGIVSLLVAPLLYALNYYCVTRLIDDAALRPPTALRLWGLAGLWFMIAAVAIAIYARTAG